MFYTLLLLQRLIQPVDVILDCSSSKKPVKVVLNSASVEPVDLNDLKIAQKQEATRKTKGSSNNSHRIAVKKT